MTPILSCLSCSVAFILGTLAGVFLMALMNAASKEPDDAVERDR